ncbi:glycosyltransferase [Butyrivibrio fibrisolvens]|uniref:glycosyltransferase n=1 Tax=Butyrivibrio fibrisolvens TaxID=831 RepID=UPI0003B775EE|nr:glycosyltransferase [Butyrivibrio fibrisolvens]
MKTILHITEVLSGGVLPVIAGICNGLSDKYRFVVAYGLRFDTPNNLEEVFDPRVKLIPLQSLKTRMSVKGDLVAIRDIKQCIKNEHPDVIHIHSTKAGIDARLGLLGCKAKKYYTPHGFCFLRRDQNAVKQAILKAMERTLSIMCDGIIACGKYEYEEAKKLTRNAFLIENGLDTGFADEAGKDVECSDHKYTIYTAGRIGPQKNPQMFNDIAMRLPDYKFVWVGEGDDRNILTSTNIEITGLLNRRDVIRMAKNCDCYLSTSLWEGLPIALMEAMYLGKKCVVSDVEGNNELISDGKTGTLFNNIKEACDQIKNAENYGEEARQFIIENYSLLKMCEKYEKVYG